MSSARFHTDPTKYIIQMMGIVGLLKNTDQNKIFYLDTFRRPDLSSITLFSRFIVAVKKKNYIIQP